MDQETVIINCFVNNEITNASLELIENEENVELKLSFHEVEYSIVADNYFEALVELRKKVGQFGIYILCKGCCKNVYSSGMILSMGEGRKAYVLEKGKQASLKDVIDIFDPCTKDEVVSVEEQNAFFFEWINSLGEK